MDMVGDRNHGFVHACGVDITRGYFPTPYGLGIDRQFG
jgi:hypothetical protein